MAFGGHYLSDVLLGGLVTLIIVEIARMLLWPRGEDPSIAEPGVSLQAKGGQTAAEVVEAALAHRQRSAGE
jgi:membrane-associated phospholipid phosphatase